MRSILSIITLSVFILFALSYQHYENQVTHSYLSYEDHRVFQAQLAKIGDVVANSDYVSYLFAYDPFIGGNTSNTSALSNLTLIADGLENISQTFHVHLVVALQMRPGGWGIIFDSNNTTYLTDPRVEPFLDGDPFQFAITNLSTSSSTFLGDTYYIRFPFIVQKANQSFRLAFNYYVKSSGFIDDLAEYKALLKVALGSIPGFEKKDYKADAEKIASYLYNMTKFYGFDSAVLVTPTALTQIDYNNTVFEIGFNSLDINQTSKTSSPTTLNAFVNTYYGGWNNVSIYLFNYTVTTSTRKGTSSATYTVATLFHGDALYLDSNYRLVWIYILVGG